MEVWKQSLYGVSKMLVEKYINGLNSRSQIEFKNISKDVIPWLEQTALENNCLIDKKEWKIKVFLISLSCTFEQSVLE